MTETDFFQFLALTALVKDHRSSQRQSPAVKSFSLAVAWQKASFTSSDLGQGQGLVKEQKIKVTITPCDYDYDASHVVTFFGIHQSLQLKLNTWTFAIRS